MHTIPILEIDTLQILRGRFSLDDFRPAQRAVIDDVLAGRDVLCVMPTGAGKSLCYQLPAVAKQGLAIVVSPLISLMADQVRQLGHHGIEAMLLNSSQSGNEQSVVMSKLHRGWHGLIYVAPERFFAPTFQPMLKQLKPDLLAIDEAHCVSHWGHDFRPEYGQLGYIRAQLGFPTTIALTATATDDVRTDIIRQLSLREPSVYVTGFDRPNLSYECVHAAKLVVKTAELLNLLRAQPGASIVYCSTRKAVDELTDQITEQLKGRPIFAYHAGMDQAARTANQAQFMSTPGAIVVATNAFGMGVNKPDIRLVVHYNFPGTLEQYYQEAGRAGRDGLPSRCVVLFSAQDRRTQEFFISRIGQKGEQSVERIQELQQIARDKLEVMVRFLRTHRCRRQMILDYFGDESEVLGCRCDVCATRVRRGQLADHETLIVDDETTTVIRKILSAIARMNSKFGVATIAEVLTGSENEKIVRRRLDQLSVYGLLRHRKLSVVAEMIRRVVEAGLAEQVDRDRNFRPVVQLTRSGIAVMKAERRPPEMLVDLLPRKKARIRHPDAAYASQGPASPQDSGAQEKRSSADPVLDQAAEQRFQSLRAARASLARDRGVPAYVICHDSTLKLIAIHEPRSLDELETLKGMGPMKVKLYGEELLAAVAGG